MKYERTMELVGKKVSFAEAEDERLLFWADKTWQERLRETERLRKMIWTFLLGIYPDRIEKVGKVVKWSSVE